MSNTGCNVITAGEAASDPRQVADLGKCEQPRCCAGRSATAIQAIRGNSVTIFECRPPWHPNLTGSSKVRVAQLRYSAIAYHWSLYWADLNGRQHRYDDLDPGPLDMVLNEIEADLTGIFWG